jgi:tRNA 2-thiouridine synthesizing protein E
MEIKIDGKIIATNSQGFISNLDDWNEEFATKLAELEGIKLYTDHWELIFYFRDFYQEYLVSPTMREMVLTLGKKKNKHFHDLKEYEKHIYKLFPTNPIHEISKLAGLPIPQPDT